MGGGGGCVCELLSIFYVSVCDLFLPLHRFSFVPLFLWCLSISTIIGLGVMFMAGVINFILVIGTK